MIVFLWGMLTMACLVIGLFFFKFWRTSRDRFFLFFALAFWVFALNWLALAASHPSDENRYLFYAVRFPTFLLLVIAILDKNRRAKS
ncbi:MAG: DUF5985 family protein [Pseudomonadota bacterium]